MNRNVRIICAAITLFGISFICAFGVDISKTGYYASKLSNSIFFTCCTFIVLGLLVLILKSAVTCGHAQLRIPGHSIFKLSFNARSVLIYTGIMLLLWSIWLIALFPGSMNWDTYYQIEQCYQEGHPILQVPYYPSNSYIDNAFSDHHPIFTTLVFGLFARTSDLLFGTWNWGIFTYILIQAFITSAVFVSSIAYLKKIGLSNSIAMLTYVFFCLAPFYPAYAATMVKDTMFAWLYVIFFMQVIHIVYTKCNCLSNTRFLLSLIGTCVFLSLTKKPGVFVVLGTLSLLMLIYRKQIFAFMAPLFASAVTMWLILPCIVFPLLDVAPGGTQEAMAPLFQQTARYVLFHEDELTDSERSSIDAILNIDDLPERYNPLDADPVKFMYNYKYTNDEMKEYLSVWFSEGLRDPKCYFDAWFATAAGYLSPSATIQIHAETGSTVSGQYDLAWQPTELNKIRSLVLGAYQAISKLPGIDMFFTIAFYTLLIPLICILLLLPRHSAWLPVFIPTLMSLICCLITPVVGTRYAIPMIYTMPLLWSLTILIATKNHSDGFEGSELSFRKHGTHEFKNHAIDD